MNDLTNFTVLIERRAHKLAPTTLLMLTMVFALLVGQRAWAAPQIGRAKQVAKDLDHVIAAGTVICESVVMSDGLVTGAGVVIRENVASGEK